MGIPSGILGDRISTPVAQIEADGKMQVRWKEEFELDGNLDTKEFLEVTIRDEDGDGQIDRVGIRDYYKNSANEDISIYHEFGLSAGSEIGVLINGGVKDNHSDRDNILFNALYASNPPPIDTFFTTANQQAAIFFRENSSYLDVMQKAFDGDYPNKIVFDYKSHRGYKGAAMDIPEAMSFHFMNYDFVVYEAELVDYDFGGRSNHFFCIDVFDNKGNEILRLNPLDPDHITAFQEYMDKNPEVQEHRAAAAREEQALIETLTKAFDETKKRRPQIGLTRIGTLRTPLISTSNRIVDALTISDRHGGTYYAYFLATDTRDRELQIDYQAPESSSIKPLYMKDAWRNQFETPVCQKFYELDPSRFRNPDPYYYDDLDD